MSCKDNMKEMNSIHKNNHNNNILHNNNNILNMQYDKQDDVLHNKPAVPKLKL